MDGEIMVTSCQNGNNAEVKELKPAPKLKKYDRTCLPSVASQWIRKLEEMTGKM
jgi:hypothetical protein